MPARSEPPSQGSSTPLVKVKRKGQMTLPRTLREQFGLHEGDYLKAEAVPDGILLTPVAIADRSILPEPRPIDHRVEERQKPSADSPTHLLRRWPAGHQGTTCRGPPPGQRGDTAVLDAGISSAYVAEAYATGCASCWNSRAMRTSATCLRPSL